MIKLGRVYPVCLEELPHHSHSWSSKGQISWQLRTYLPSEHPQQDTGKTHVQSANYRAGCNLSFSQQLVEIQGCSLYHLVTFVNNNPLVWTLRCWNGHLRSIFWLLKGLWHCTASTSSWELVAHNFNRYVIQWIADYLTFRMQQVVVAGETSKVADVLSGVPQGSVLGLLLFLIYIDGIGTISISTESEWVMFTDDLLLHRPITRPSECARRHYQYWRLVNG